VLAHGEEDVLRKAALDELHASPDGLTTPEAEHLEVHALAALRMSKDEIGHAQPRAGKIQDVRRRRDLQRRLDRAEVRDVDLM
jgi:hypothetical protein